MRLPQRKQGSARGTPNTRLSLRLSGHSGNEGILKELSRNRFSLVASLVFALSGSRASQINIASHGFLRRSAWLRVFCYLKYIYISFTEFLMNILEPAREKAESSCPENAIRIQPMLLMGTPSIPAPRWLTELLKKPTDKADK